MKILHRNPKPMTKQTEMCVLLYLQPLKAVNVYYKILNDSLNISTYSMWLFSFPVELGTKGAAEIVSLL